MKVSFLDFWGGFDTRNNFITHILSRIVDIEVVENPYDSDIIVYTCFGNRHLEFTNRKPKIFFTGENIRPDYTQCNLAISFDVDSEKNVRIPLWYHYIDWFGYGTYGNPKYLIPTEDLYKQHDDFRELFCATVYSAPHMNRAMMVTYLNTYKEVDCYGKIHKYSLQDGEDVKLNMLKKYKFSICMENSIHKGYYTEKLLHAKVAGTVPIYYCDDNVNMDFNDKCFINLNGKTYTEVVDIVKEIDNNNNLYNEIRNQPLFNSTIDISNMINKLKIAFIRNGIIEI